MAAPKLYTWTEVSEHNKDGDLWVVHQLKEKNKEPVFRVLDLSKFSNHPGGPEVLFEHGGTDITKSFADIAHSSEAVDMIKDFIIGEIDPTSEKPKPKSIERTDPPGTLQSLMFPLLILVLAILGYFYL